MLLSGFLYALLSLSDQLLLSFALVFAPVLHDFVSLTKKTSVWIKRLKQESRTRLFFSCRYTLGWTTFSNALADSS